MPSSEIEQGGMSSGGNKQEGKNVNVGKKFSQMEKRFFNIRLKRNEQRKHNIEEVIHEEMRKEKKDFKEIRKRKREFLESMDELTMKHMDQWNKKKRKVEKAPGEFGEYFRETKRSLYTMEEYKFADGQDRDDYIERMVGELKKRLTKKEKKRRKTKGTNISINKKNEIFNSRLERSKNPYAEELRANIERGTAI